MRKIKLTTFAFGLLLAPSSYAGSELASMDLEQLMDMNVTTVSKRSQSFASAAAAIYTITQADIHRSGATSLPEILKLAPGMEVARINESAWAITARGFNNDYSNKLLVLVDGRSIYSPLFSGVYWDAQMPPLDDIQRIEVIRGPGASLWGSNAVNGVINVITYDSDQTQGGQVVVGAGNEEKGFLRGRYGFKQGQLTGRINTQYRAVERVTKDTGSNFKNNDFQSMQIGGRLDYRPTSQKKGSFEISYTDVHKALEMVDPLYLLPAENPNDNLFHRSYFVKGHWLNEFENGDSVYFQSYYDSEIRHDILGGAEYYITDFELQYNNRASEQHRITWGINHRETRDELIGKHIVTVPDSRRAYQLDTLFIQDEITFTDTLSSALGVKLEKNASNDLENQPSLRMSWQPVETSTFWAAISRAARTPSRLESSVEQRFVTGRYYQGLNTYILVKNNPEVENEILTACEAGWRWIPNNSVLVDIATYRNRYKHLLTYKYLPADQFFELRYLDQGFIGQSLIIENTATGTANGLEVAIDFTESDQWKLKSTYSYFQLDVDTPDNALLDGNSSVSPRHQIQLTSYHTLPNAYEFDWHLRFVDELVDGLIPSYTDIGFRVEKTLSEHIRISLIGNNLLKKSRYFDLAQAYDTRRGFYVQMEWR